METATQISKNTANAFQSFFGRFSGVGAHPGEIAVLTLMLFAVVSVGVLLGCISNKLCCSSAKYCGGKERTV